MVARRPYESFLSFHTCVCVCVCTYTLVPNMHSQFDSHNTLAYSCSGICLSIDTSQLVHHEGPGCVCLSECLCDCCSLNLWHKGSRCGLRMQMLWHRCTDILNDGFTVSPHRRCLRVQMKWGAGGCPDVCLCVLCVRLTVAVLLLLSSMIAAEYVLEGIPVPADWSSGCPDSFSNLKTIRQTNSQTSASVLKSVVVKLMGVTRQLVYYFEIRRCCVRRSSGARKQVKWKSWVEGKCWFFSFVFCFPANWHKSNQMSLSFNGWVQFHLLLTVK